MRSYSVFQSSFRCFSLFCVLQSFVSNCLRNPVRSLLLQVLKEHKFSVEELSKYKVCKVFFDLAHALAFLLQFGALVETQGQKRTQSKARDP